MWGLMDRRPSRRPGLDACLYVEAASPHGPRIRIGAGNCVRPMVALNATVMGAIALLEVEAEPRHYWMSTLSAKTSFRKLVFNAMGRWMIEREYEELKSELGLSHYEGRNWRGFHHHATLCIAAYGFLMLERLRTKKNSARLHAPAIPQGFRPRGSLSDATPQSALHRIPAIRSRKDHRPKSPPVSVLRQNSA